MIYQTFENTNFKKKTPFPTQSIHDITSHQVGENGTCLFHTQLLLVQFVEFDGNRTANKLWLIGLTFSTALFLACETLNRKIIQLGNYRVDYSSWVTPNCVHLP